MQLFSDEQQAKNCSENKNVIEWDPYYISMTFLFFQGFFSLLDMFLYEYCWVPYPFFSSRIFYKFYSTLCQEWREAIKQR
jgi:hypothetical protein